MKEITSNKYLRVKRTGMDGGFGTIKLPRQNKKGYTEASIIWSWGAGWEHVSVSSYKKRQLPDWDIMCRLKEAFWEDEEMVVQIHPKKSEYVHGVGDLGNVLHLWRPVGGDWSRMEKG